MDRRLMDYLPEMETGSAMPLALPGESTASYEMEAGAGLLEVTRPAALEAFLTAMVKRAGPMSAALTGELVANLARALWPLFPIRARPGAQAPSDDLKNRAARLFGIELEGLSPEDKEFETARHAVRFIAAAIDIARSLAARHPARGAASPMQARALAQAALHDASREHAPGLLRRAVGTARSGLWLRRGGRIEVLDC